MASLLDLRIEGCALSSEEEKEETCARAAGLAARTFKRSDEEEEEEEEDDDDASGVAENVNALMSPSTLLNTARSCENVTGE